jgi:two-component system chemotaxis response regulator CheB
MSTRDIIVIGASAGGVEALTELMSQLPPDFPAAVFVVLHISAHGTSVLPRILTRAGSLSAIHPQDGQAIQSGRIYIAPPDQHLLVKQGYITLARGPRENGHRPAVDPLFRSAARAYGRRVIGVVLSGVLDDGTAGLLAVKSRGGIAVVQDPEDALYSGMPLSAVENIDVDYVTPMAEMGSLLVRLAHEVVIEKEEKPVSEKMEQESDIAELEKSALEGNNPGIPSVFACPECGGTLWEVHEGDLIRFRCRVGHAYSAQTLLAHQSESLEEAFWVALRALEESAALSHRLAHRARERGNTRSAAHFDEQEQAAKAHAEIVRNVLLNGKIKPQVEEETDSIP